MAQSERNWLLGVQVGSGPHGALHLAQSHDGDRAWLEIAITPDDELAIQVRADRLAAVRHPFLLRVRGLTRIDDRLSLVLDSVDGVDLGCLLVQGPVPVVAAIDLFRKAARALHAGYDRKPGRGRPYGLVHGALDFSSLLIGLDGSVHLHGLGMLGPDGEGLTVLPENLSAGTLAPERRAGAAATHAADVYALGYLLVAALGLDADEALVAAAVESVAGPVLEGTNTAAALGRLVASMLAVDPTLRPTAQVVDRGLERMRRRLDKGALQAWAASAVPSVAQRGLSAADLPERSENVPPGELPAAAPPSLESLRGRRLWEIRGPSEPGGPSRVLEWFDPSRETTERVSTALLRDSVPAEPAEDPSELIDLVTGRFLVTQAGLAPAAEDDGLGVAVLPRDNLPDTADEALEDTFDETLEDTIEDLEDDPSTEERTRVGPEADQDRGAAVPPAVPQGRPEPVGEPGLQAELDDIDEAGFQGGDMPLFAESDRRGGGWSWLWVAAALLVLTAGAWWVMHPDAAEPEPGGAIQSPADLAPVVGPKVPVPVAPEVVAPEVVAPKVGAPEVVAPKVVAPKVVAPKVVAPKVVAPKVVAPKVVAPA
ncbi:MAG: hypothetical protein GXP62_11870, partial [Oligoflexia bacterium]|nr:hypothetical protein [Oligoflexia bacterium]